MITSKRKERKRTRYMYTFQGQVICKNAFVLIYDTIQKVLRNIAKHLNEKGDIPREHGNTGKYQTISLKYDEIRNAVTFILNYVGEVGMPQSEDPRGSDGIPTVYLPSSDSKKDIQKRYVASCKESEFRALNVSSFQDIWLKCIPHINLANLVMMFAIAVSDCGKRF